VILVNRLKVRKKFKVTFKDWFKMLLVKVTVIVEDVDGLLWVVFTMSHDW